MRQSIIKGKCDTAGGTFGQLAAEKKKIAVAVCLIVIMAFMWIRMIAKRAPQGAQAAVIAQVAILEGQSEEKLKISFTDMAKVKGRNDVLSRDFFAADGWAAFRDKARGGGTKRVDLVSADTNEAMSRRIANKLTLDGIVTGRQYQAFINDRLLSVGSKFGITDGDRRYEFEVMEILENMVLIRSSEAEFVLKLGLTVGTDD